MPCSYKGAIKNVPFFKLYSSPPPFFLLFSLSSLSPFSLSPFFSIFSLHFCLFFFLFFLSLFSSVLFFSSVLLFSLFYFSPLFSLLSSFFSFIFFFLSLFLPPFFPFLLCPPGPLIVPWAQPQCCWTTPAVVDLNGSHAYFIFFQLMKTQLLLTHWCFMVWEEKLVLISHCGREALCRRDINE